jgi:ABC-2 type transport system permease protein
MREVLLIARREYMERVRSRSFLLMTILFPVMIGLLTGGSFFAGKLSSRAKNIAIASNDAGLAKQVAAELRMSSDRHPAPQVIAPASEAQRAELNQRVESKALDGYLWLQTIPGSAAPEATFVSRSASDLFSQGDLESAVNYGVERLQLMQHGVTAAEMMAMKHDVKIATMQIRNGRLAPSNSLKSFAGAYVMVFLIYFAVVFYGMNVARSVVEEKTSRIFEVLLSTVEPQSLMAGKLLGVGAAGLTQLAIWCALVVALVGTSLRGAGSGTGGLAAFGVHPAQIFFLILYFLLGFFFYSAIAAAIGASVSSEQEIQQFSMVIVAPLLVGIILMSYIISSPTAPAVVLLSLFPPCTPVVMFLRMSSQMPPAWQIALSMVLMIVFIWAAIWFASRVYRVGILMYGKRATLPEILRWMRYS